ncbi:MAG: hypothetical protein WBC04_21810 [Candidatus Acidiferrales bacterium]
MNVSIETKKRPKMAERCKAKGSSRKIRKPRRPTKFPRRTNIAPQPPAVTQPEAQKVARQMINDDPSVGPESSSFPGRLEKGDNASWERFRSRYIRPEWFCKRRHKTLKALQRVWKAIPQQHLDRLPERLIIFAPDPKEIGGIHPCPDFKEDGNFMYLTSDLESMFQVQVNIVVAHEFAHVVLGHVRLGRPHATLPCEWAADRLALQWGFKSFHDLPKKQKPQKKGTTPTNQGACQEDTAKDDVIAIKINPRRRPWSPGNFLLIPKATAFGELGPARTGLKETTTGK